ncbi:hypothetical protein G3T14_07775 [Methylobacterium sp. BTF04]|uniref:hypothetical protein n=1 Tax=Methylobacterium sp. BTF04 TaxID=2708300 RepID=UPI0013D67058|nr:hypothetical protein [Methylobacterium sp. BTF04]NEU12027.1 hypothetical protein [Methylobacterium sp. BTF04]
MRVLRWMIVCFGMLGGAIGLGQAVQATPLPVSAMDGSVQRAPLVEQARWHGYRRHHWHRRHYGYRRHYWHRRHYRPAYGWRRHHGWRPHYGWHRHHHHRRFYF